MRRTEATAIVNALPESLFARLDDQSRLADHMGRPSLMTGGGRMTYSFDEGKGRAVGSHILMGGNAFGLNLSVDEVVTQREPPRLKSWRTVGTPKLIVIGGYELGFEITPESAGSRLRVWISYDRPAGGLGRWAPFLGDLYARWCVGRMVADARAWFSKANRPL